MRSVVARSVLVAGLIGLGTGLITACPATAQDALPDGPGKAETIAACGGCHGTGQILGEHRSADAWTNTVTYMINFGAPVADADFDKVVGYLTANFGPQGQPTAASAPVNPQRQ